MTGLGRRGRPAALRRTLRQWRQPSAFRIAAPVWDAERRRLLERAVADVATAHEAREVGRLDDTGRLDEKALAAAASNLWRARRRLLRDGGDGSRETRQLLRLLASAQDSLAEAGVEVQDHDGAVFDSGYSLEVLAFEPDAALDVETVQETLRPSVYLGDRRIQMAQVIVGQPVDGATSGG